MTHNGSRPQVLLCPRCGFDYVKITAILMFAGQPPQMYYQCEECPGGTLELNFHKGQTFIEEA